MDISMTKSMGQNAFKPESNDNKNSNPIEVSNFNNSDSYKESEKENNNQRGSRKNRSGGDSKDASKAHSSRNNKKGTTTDKDGKVRDHTNLIKSMNNFTEIKTSFNNGKF